MPVIRNAESRRTETPNAVMTTLASPTQGGAGQAVWRVDMRPGQSGPLHAIDTEQVWTVRRVSADPLAGFAAIAVAPAGTRAYTLDGTKVAPGYAVPDGDKLAPAWVA